MVQRKTSLPSELPEARADEFVQSKQDQWQAFLRAAGVAEAPQNLVAVLEASRGFLLPMLLTGSYGQPMHGDWRAPGPWRDQAARS
jgi:hypothetical protein